MSNLRDHASASSGGIVVRLDNDGDRVVGVFCGVPYPREVVWTGDRYETYDPDVHINKRTNLRVMINFYVPAEHAMRVLEGGAVWIKGIIRLRNEYGLDAWLFEVRRYGELDLWAEYTIRPEQKLESAQLDEITNIKLHDLASLVTP